MSNAMRSGKRLLAGVAAAGLGAGLLVGLTAAPASAAITGITETVTPVATNGASASTIRVDDLTYKALPTSSTGTQAGAVFAASAATTFSTTTLVVTYRPTYAATTETPISTVNPTNVTAGASAKGSSTANLVTGVTLTSTADTNADSLQFSNPNASGVSTLTGVGTGAASVTLAVGRDSLPGVYKILLTKGSDTEVAEIVVAGVPASTVVANTTADTVVAGSTVSFLASVRDSGGRPTYLLGAERLDMTASGTGVTITTPALASLGAGDITPGNAMRTSANVVATAGQTASGTYTVTATPAGGLTIAAGSDTMTVQSTSGQVPSTSLKIAAGADDLVYTGEDACTTNAVANKTLPDGQVVAACGIVSTAVPTATFTATANSAGNILFNISQTSGVPLPAGVTTGFVVKPTALIGAVNTAVLDITATPLAGTGYTVSDGVHTWNVLYQTPIAYNVRNFPTATFAAQTGGSATATVQVRDQFGAGFSGATGNYTVSGRNTVVATAATSAANGVVTANYTDRSTSTTNLTDTVAFTMSVGAAITAGVPNTTRTTAAVNATVRWTADLTVGTVTLAGFESNNLDGYKGTATATGVAEALIVATAKQAGNPAATDLTDNQVQVNAVVRNTAGAVIQGVAVSVTGSEGVFFASGAGPTAVAVAPATRLSTLSLFTDASGLVQFEALFTKTGTNTITVSSGGKTSTYVVEVYNAAGDARILSVSPAKVSASSRGAAELVATVKDGYGNPVAGATVNASATTPGVFGAVSSIQGTTNEKGIVTFSLTAAGAATGVSEVSFVGTGGQFATTAAAAATQATTLGLAAPVRLGASEVTFTGAPADRSITITGSRTTVSGKPGIKIDGAVTGIENGKTVVPYFRFPGETTFAQGTARPVISGGKFTWERKTGKKFYAYVTNDDGAVKSNRVIIAAN